MRKGPIGIFLASCIMLSFCFPVAAAAEIDDSAAAGISEHAQVLSDEKIMHYYANGGIVVPAHTTVYLAQADILSYVEISIDCVDELYFGICTQGDGNAVRLGAKTEDICSFGSFTPEETGSYYIYLCNDTDEDVSADVVALTGEWIEIMNEYRETHAIHLSTHT